ncbi:MAG: hypothetical protein J6B04_01455 [Clostridia bacterium]|nr:hypothetical protein [Clostridia bacterium]
MGKVFIVDYKHEADYKVFFCNYRHEEKNAQIIAGCKLANYKHEANIKVFIVNYKHEADILIMRENFPKR